MPDEARDPQEWIGRFMVVHMARHFGQPWPEVGGHAFDALLEAWLHHFRARKVTPEMADKASLALMLVKHFPNSHLAEFFEAMPEPPPEYHRIDPRAWTHWKTPGAARPSEADGVTDDPRPGRRPAAPESGG